MSKSGGVFQIDDVTRTMSKGGGVRYGPAYPWVWPTPWGRCWYPPLVPLSRRSHAARCRVWSFSTKIPKNTTYRPTSDHLDHLEELPGNHLVGGYGPPPGEGVGILH